MKSTHTRDKREINILRIIMKTCISPHNKYILSTTLAPLSIVLTLILLHQFEALKPYSSFLFFIAFIAGVSLILYSTSIACPKCQQKIGCDKDGHCFLFFTFNILKGLVWKHCKKCEYDLSLCEEDEENKPNQV